MVVDMGYDIEIIGVLIVCVKDGLVLSLCNGYLIVDQCKIVSGLYKVLSVVVEKLVVGDWQFDEIIVIVEQELNEKGFCVDDIQICDVDILFELIDVSQCVVILMVVWLGQVCLIDNWIVMFVQQIVGKNWVILFGFFLGWVLCLFCYIKVEGQKL